MIELKDIEHLPVIKNPGGIHTPFEVSELEGTIRDDDGRHPDRIKRLWYVAGRAKLEGHTCLVMAKELVKIQDIWYVQGVNTLDIFNSYETIGSF